MFVRLPGASKETAFRVGKEIANYITTLFPEPIKLKFEKVLLSSPTGRLVALTKFFDNTGVHGVHPPDKEAVHWPHVRTGR